MGLTVRSSVKNSLAPGSRVVTEYLQKTGLQAYLDKLGFNLVGYGCTTCIGNSGPLDPNIEQVLTDHDLIAASVLSGNRNFEARVHQSIKANFLMSPPLVVAFAIAGRVDIDLSNDPLGKGSDGKDVYLRDIWPNLAGDQRAVERGDGSGNLSPALSRLRSAESFVERDSHQHRQRLSVGHRIDLHSGAAVLRKLQ